MVILSLAVPAIEEFLTGSPASAVWLLLHGCALVVFGLYCLLFAHELVEAWGDRRRRWWLRMPPTQAAESFVRSSSILGMLWGIAVIGLALSEIL